MAETMGMTAVIILVLLLLVAVYLIMRFLDGGKGGEDEEEVAESPYSAPVSPSMKEEDFIDTYTGPMLEDGLESLDTAVGFIKQGCSYYSKGGWEEAGGEFHSAVKSIDEAANNFKEVTAMIEDQSLPPVKKAKARMEESRQFRVMAIKMEEACDAMVEGKQQEAEELASVKEELAKMAEAWHP